MEVPTVVLLFYLACVSSLSPVSPEAVYCVNPEQGEPCDCSGITNDCQTLDYYFSATEDYFTPGVTFRFMSGDHYSHHTLKKSGLANLQFVRDGADTVVIIIDASSEYAWFTASNSHNFSFRGLQFVSDNYFKYIFGLNNVSDFILEETSFTSNYSAYLSISYGHNIMISNASISTGNYPDVHISNTTGYVVIQHCHFTGQSNLASIHIQGSNYPFTCSLNNTVVISNSRFYQRYGVSTVFHNASGCLNIFIEQSVFIETQKIGLHVVSTASSTSTFKLGLEIDSSIIYSNYDVGVFLSMSVFDYVFIRNCTFSNNKNTALEICVQSNSNSSVLVENSVFSQNNVPSLTPNVFAQVFFVRNSDGCMEKGIKNFQLNNVTFLENGPPLGVGDLEKPIAIVCLREVILTNCSFIRNSGTPLMVTNSQITLDGELHFTNNTAREGGGIYFYGNSIMYPKETASIYFTENHAMVTGGAIQISNNVVDPPFSHPICFLQSEQSNIATHLIFSNNTAGIGGDIIYGGSLDLTDSNCISSIKKSSNFSQDGQRNNLSWISSTPSRVCLCESKNPDCLKFSKLVSVFPGETVEFYAFTVGQGFGTSKGIVYAQFLDADNSVPLSVQQRSQKVNQYNCESNVLSYTMKSMKENATNILALTAIDIIVDGYYNVEAVEKAVDLYNKTGNNRIEEVLLQVPVFVIASFKRCPAGFKFAGNSCECIDQLQALTSQFNVHCFISSVPAIQRKGTLWIDASENKFQYSEKCLTTHCNTATIKVRQNSSDEQCIDNHSGPLCGRCKKNFSLAIGSSRCLSHCSDKYLSFLVLFAGAGVLMVAIIKYLNLTVTHGGLNGLIFYANIIQTSNTAFLPSNQTGVSNRLFAVLIAWLNLDFGIETCFSSDLDMYAKTWLQFVFPFYIWGLVLVIILICRYSQKATRFFGNNTVQVLCTLFILSYNKILRTITVVLSMAEVEHIDVLTSHQATQIVWSYDGDYQSKHIALLAFSSAVLIFLWVPFTTFLILGPWLQRWNHHRGLKWVARMTPLLDAFYSPHKDRHRYWVGVLLLARVVVIIPAAIPSSDTSATVLTVALLSASLLFYTSSVAGVYKKKYLSLLEDSFLANLIAFSALSFYSDSSKEIAGYIGFIHVSLILLIIVGVQLYRKLEGKSCNRPFCCTNVWFIEPTNAEASSTNRAGYSDLDEDQSREIINNTESSS